MIEKTLNEINQEMIDTIEQIDNARTYRDSEHLRQCKIKMMEASYWLSAHAKKITKRAQNVNEYQQEKKKLGV